MKKKAFSIYLVTCACVNICMKDLIRSEEVKDTKYKQTECVLRSVIEKL